MKQPNSLQLFGTQSKLAVSSDRHSVRKHMPCLVLWISSRGSVVCGVTIKDPSFAWSRPEIALKGEHPGLMITDCKSLYDLITKTAVPNCQEWRTTIEVMLLKEQSREHTLCRWVSTAIMLADSLTKIMDSTFLRTVLQLGKFRIYDESMTLKQNANRKFGVTWVNNRI